MAYLKLHSTLLSVSHKDHVLQGIFVFVLRLPLARNPHIVHHLLTISPEFHFLLC